MAVSDRFQVQEPDEGSLGIQGVIVEEDGVFFLISLCFAVLWSIPPDGLQTFEGQ